MKIKQEIINNIKEKMETLHYKGDSVRIYNVCPALLEEVLGDFDDGYELNGYDCDYWASLEGKKYEVFGCMRYGYAEITLAKGDKRPKNKTRVEENPYTKSSFQGSWMTEPWTDIPPVVKCTKKQLEMLLEKGILHPYHITFTGTTGGSYVIIYAKDEMDARKRAFTIWGRNWSDINDEEQWEAKKQWYEARGEFSSYWSERQPPLVLDWNVQGKEGNKENDGK